MKPDSPNECQLCGQKFYHDTVKHNCPVAAANPEIFAKKPSTIKQAIEAMSVRTWFMVDDCIYPTKPKESKYGRSTAVIPLAAALEWAVEQRNEAREVYRFLKNSSLSSLIESLNEIDNAEILSILKGSEG